MGSSQFTSGTVGSYLLLFGLVFGVAASVDKRAFGSQLLNKSAWLTAIFIQFVVLPVFGYGIGRALGLQFASGITLLLITTSPGGGYSNLFCSVFNGDLALSVTLTTISTMLSIIMIPCNLILYAASIYEHELVDSIQWSSVFLSIFTVLVAAIAGLIFSGRMDSAQFNILALTMSYICGICHVIFQIIVMIYSDGSRVNLFSQSWEFYVGIASPCVVGVVLATVFTINFQLPKPECVSVAIECFFPNVGISSALAIVMFDGEVLANALAIPVYYSIVEFVVLVIFSITSWKIGWTKAPKNESFLVMIIRPYEILEYVINAQKEKEAQKESDDDIRVVSDAHVINVVDEFVDNAMVDVDLETPVVVDLALVRDTVASEEKRTEVFFDDGTLQKKRIFSFRNKAKVMDSQSPKLSPISVLSPQAFDQTSKNGKSFKRSKRTGGKKSFAVKQLIIEETINEDSLAEDPDISIAGESDLESGLSVSLYDGDEISLSGFSFNRPSSRHSSRPSSRASVRILEEDSQLVSVSKEQIEDAKPTQGLTKEMLLDIEHDDLHMSTLTEGTVNEERSSSEQLDELALNKNDVPLGLQHSTEVEEEKLDLNDSSRIDASNSSEQANSNEVTEVKKRRTKEYQNGDVCEIPHTFAGTDIMNGSKEDFNDDDDEGVDLKDGKELGHSVNLRTDMSLDEQLVDKESIISGDGETNHIIDETENKIIESEVEVVSGDDINQLPTEI